MIAEERLVSFLHSLEEGNTGVLYEIEREALSSFVPIIRRETQSLLRLLMAMKRPARILEVGCAVGFSAILMAESNPAPCEIVTIENYGKRIPVARENFRRAGREGQIRLLGGDAGELLPALEGSFDFIFLDAAKGQYLSFLPHLMRLLAPGGTLVTDNVLQEGDILESRFVVTRRNRTIHKRMREYLYQLTHDPRLVTAVLPVGDGVTISERRNRQGEEAERKHYEETGIAGSGQQS